MPRVSKKAKERRLKSFGDHQTFLNRISKNLYYGSLPNTDRLSFPVTELASELFSEAHKGRSLDRLHFYDASEISRNVCVSPCSFILAMLYLDRLKSCNPEYLQKVTASELFVISLMVSNKFLYDSGEDGEVYLDQWAECIGLSIEVLVELEKDFLVAIDWNVYVSNSTFWNKMRELEMILAKREGTARGWFTYTELSNLLSMDDAHALCHYLQSASVILLSAYFLGLLVVIGSMAISLTLHGMLLDAGKPTNEILVDNNETIKVDTYDQDVLVKLNHEEMDRCNVTSILVTLQTVNFNDTSCDIKCLNKSNEEDITWDWWNNPLLDWLSKISQSLQDFARGIVFNTRDEFNADAIFIMTRAMELEDQIHKGTKIRIQDQLETSWHKEWTDVIKNFA